MKNDTLLIIGAAAVGLYFIARTAKAMGTSKSPSSTGAGRQTAIPSDTFWQTPSPNQSMTLADQYKNYGYGESLADAYGSSGYLETTK